MSSETPTPTHQQPDIEYHPDEIKWRARTARRLAENPGLEKVPLPEGFPKQVEGPIVWEGSDWVNEDQWVYNLSSSELEEIEGGLKHFKNLNVPMGYLSKDTFALSTLSTTLTGLARELYSGRGFFVLRALPVDKYSREDIAIIYAGKELSGITQVPSHNHLPGISSHVGRARGKQDDTGAVLAHIKDLRVSHAHEGNIGNAAYTTDKQVFHTDVGDLIALLALQSAAEGGVSKISSGGRVYNEIAATRPDLIRTMSEPWILDRFGATPPYTTRPVLYVEEGHAIIQYSRRHFTGYGDQKRGAEIPPITEAQAEALDTMHFLAEKYSLGLNFQKGDIQYINSMGLLHAREAFRDDEEHTRHLIRLWLRRDDLAWKTPGPLEHIWKKLYSISPEQQRFPLEPEIRKTASGKTK
ncbi:hypothetical protein BDZ94DRAFT_1235994 [Collybia nuda]|uniref:TauD/TfdA-like domain-containing protein n=1 Tax=Collybia nuda TaxID=64659 RepID=A0A9P5Y8K2_9AGAR|nr:hypothetical protein BDZ94DRAFT_1235994 [Collybia nuda]